MEYCNVFNRYTGKSSFLFYLIYSYCLRKCELYFLQMADFKVLERDFDKIKGKTQLKNVSILRLDLNEKECEICEFPGLTQPTDEEEEILCIKNES